MKILNRKRNDVQQGRGLVLCNNGSAFSQQLHASMPISALCYVGLNNSEAVNGWFIQTQLALIQSLSRMAQMARTTKMDRHHLALPKAADFRQRFVCPFDAAQPPPFPSFLPIRAYLIYPRRVAAGAKLDCYLLVPTHRGAS